MLANTGGEICSYSHHQIGAANTNSYALNGYMDELRVTVGKSLYNSTSFAVPTAAFSA